MRHTSAFRASRLYASKGAPDVSAENHLRLYPHPQMPGHLWSRDRLPTFDCGFQREEIARSHVESGLSVI